MEGQTETAVLANRLAQQKDIISNILAVLQERDGQLSDQTFQEITEILSGIDYLLDQFLRKLKQGEVRPGDEYSLVRLTRFVMLKIQRP